MRAYLTRGESVYKTAHPPRGVCLRVYKDTLGLSVTDVVDELMRIGCGTWWMREGTKVSRRGYTFATSCIGQCCKEMDHFMQEGASQQINLIEAEILTLPLFDWLETKANLPV